MKVLSVLGFLFLFTSRMNAQDSTIQKYESAYMQLAAYLNNPFTGSFKKAIYTTESTFGTQKSSFADFENEILVLAMLAQGYAQANPPTSYRYADSVNFIKNFALYKLLVDTIAIQLPDNRTALTRPFSYDFSDFFGRENWGNMFVSKLLSTHKGNCHSLPYLYKILADELDATCWLGLAPNHIYIKNRCKKTGWYNTELTSGTFPIDAWVTASGYIPLQAIQNGIYMDTLSNQQAIALCVLDLAKGYEFQTHNYDDGFILKCCDLVLQYHPVNVQAMLLKAETLKRVYKNQTLARSEAAQATYNEMEGLYVKLFESGYREMPESMYLDWLKSVTTESNKYTDKNLKDAMPLKKRAF